jgi:hypothetical protein
MLNPIDNKYNILALVNMIRENLRKLKIRGSNKRCKGRVEHRVEKTFPKGKTDRCFEKP